jgi:hypothetical protein
LGRQGLGEEEVVAVVREEGMGIGSAEQTWGWARGNEMENEMGNELVREKVNGKVRGRRKVLSQLVLVLAQVLVLVKHYVPWTCPARMAMATSWALQIRPRRLLPQRPGQSLRLHSLFRQEQGAVYLWWSARELGCVAAANQRQMEARPHWGCLLWLEW